MKTYNIISYYHLLLSSLVIISYYYSDCHLSTGAPCETYRFADSSVSGKIKDGSLWSLLVEMDRNGYILTASTPGEDHFSTGAGGRPESGLVPGHAYSLIAAKELSNGVKIVHVSDFPVRYCCDHVCVLTTASSSSYSALSGV
jgi:hypothetical protein